MKILDKIKNLYNNKKLFIAVLVSAIILIAAAIILIIALTGSDNAEEKNQLDESDVVTYEESNNSEYSFDGEEETNNSNISNVDTESDESTQSEDLNSSNESNDDIISSNSDEDTENSHISEDNANNPDESYEPITEESIGDGASLDENDNQSTNDSVSSEESDYDTNNSSNIEDTNNSTSDSSTPEDETDTNTPSIPEQNDSSTVDTSSPEEDDDDNNIGVPSVPEEDNDSSANVSSVPEEDNDSSANVSSVPEEDDDNSAVVPSAPEEGDDSANAPSTPEVEDNSSFDSSTPMEDSSQNDTSDEIVSTDAMFTDRDLKNTYNSSGAIVITLSGNKILCNFPQYVNINGTTAKIVDEGVFIISGTLDNGMIMVEAEITDKIQIVLNNATISSNSSAPLYIKQADKVFITTASDSSNTLVTGSQFIAIDENNIDAAIFSKEDLTLNGRGSLTIQSPAGHGIVSKDDLVMTGGTYTVITGGHAFSGKNSLRIGGGTYIIRAGKDGFHAEDADNTASGFLYTANVTGSINANITAGGDAISGQSYLTLNGGYFEAICANGSTASIDSTLSAKGVKATGTVTINNGTTLNLNTADDGVHSNGNILVNGGNLTITSAFDGFQADGTLTINNGTFNITAGGGSNAYSNSTSSAKAIKATGILTINNGNFVINSADDGIHSNTDININGGIFNISTGDDSVHSDTNLNVTGGTITVPKSYEGLEATNIVISGGEITVTSSDDGLNAAGGVDSSGTATGGTPTRPGRPGRPGDNFSAGNGSIKIIGGTLHINANGDGVDANGTLDVSGGNVYVSGPTSGGNGSLDYDATASVSGGTFIAIGSKQMAMNFSSASNQGCALFTFSTTQAANTTITLKDSNGTVLLSWTADKTYSSVVISCPDFKIGGSYVLTAGTYSSGTFTLTGTGIYKKNG